MKTLFVVLFLVSFTYISNCQYFNGKNHQVDNSCIWQGSNILTIDFIHVWDNGEGKNPFGGGSDRAPYPGIFSVKDFFLGWKHGPYGNIHVKVYNLQGSELFHVSNLPGPEWTGDKFEWKDNQWMTYSNFGIFNWDFFPRLNSVKVVLYESDPWREHDKLIEFIAHRDYNKYQVYSSQKIPELHVITTSLPLITPNTWKNPSSFHIWNDNVPLALFFDICSSNGGCDQNFVLKPKQYTRIYIDNTIQNFVSIRSRYDPVSWGIEPGGLYRFFDPGYNPRIILMRDD